METKILDKLTEQDIFGLIYMATGGQMCSDNQKNVLIRGDVYKVKSSPKNLIGRLLLPNQVFKIKFNDKGVIYSNGKQFLPLINLSFSNVMQEFIHPIAQNEDSAVL